MLYKTVKQPYYKWYKINFFPFKTSKKSTKKHTVVLGIGGNIGDTKRRFQKLFILLRKEGFTDIIKTSMILKNPPFGYKNQAFFYNAVMVLKTNLTPLLLLRYFQKKEKKFKRKRDFKNSPRTLDLDIIFYDKITLNKPNLTIPHPKWKERDSVKLPLWSLRWNKKGVIR